MHHFICHTWACLTFSAMSMIVIFIDINVFVSEERQGTKDTFDDELFLNKVFAVYCYF